MTQEDHVLGTRPRVVRILGNVPVDTVYLEREAELVDLAVVHCSFTPARLGPPRALPDGIRSYPLPPVQRFENFSLGYVFRGLHRVLSRERPDVVHVVMEPWAMLCLQAARWVRAHPGTHLVMHGCDCIWHHGGRLEQLLRRVAVRYTLGTSSAFVAESSLALGLAPRAGLPQAAPLVRNHANPRDSSLFRVPDRTERARARAALGVADGQLAIGMVCRVNPEKGVRVFLDAAAHALEGGLRARFFVAGAGPLAAEVERHPVVQLLGPLAHPQGVVGLLHGLDILACPSVRIPNWEDAAPRSVIEAMMCGVVPVGSRSGGIPELLGGHGVLVPQHDVPALADAFGTAGALCRNDTARTQLSAWTLQTYSASAAARTNVALWTRLAERAATAPDHAAIAAPGAASG